MNSKLKTNPHSPRYGAANAKLQKLVSTLLDWFATDARDLPWRRTRDPYAIWVSEIIIQLMDDRSKRVATGQPCYRQ